MGIPETLRWDGDRLVLIDQTRLPADVHWVACETPEQVAEAIRGMVVRGAPAIGVAAAWGMALAARGARGHGRDAALARLREAASTLVAARPTAVNLAWAVAALLAHAEGTPGDGAALAEALTAEARRLHDADVATNRAIGQAGRAVVPDGANVLTHCNAGALATAGYGTAVGVLRAAHEAGRRLHVWVDETRPYWQGARLTAWELVQLGIPATLITDSMAAHFMARGAVDLVVVGADRIAANGDTANKIGTYGLAVLAAAHAIPLYVAAPRSTFDASVASGAGIPIEERPEAELTHVAGRRLAAEGVGVANPGFDVTPAHLIAGIITEVGVLTPPYGPAIQAALAARSPSYSAT
ncbi:MAG: S-methyl-5-thioribose-1-phosphate isomerase [Candidatus Sericytochromatia bacterium]|nr:S-methyl-5-thioribose-1-phosphate isomerase [Candidatus Sericytochromatia bacterium]